MIERHSKNIFNYNFVGIVIETTTNYFKNLKFSIVVIFKMEILGIKVHLEFKIYLQKMSGKHFLNYGLFINIRNIKLDMAVY